MDLSIIIPIYNVEKYLQKCVDSLFCQDLPKEEYEVILVNDGSPDKCGEIADEYAAKYSNIRVIHQENRGLSVARNTGLAAATGEYIQFVDADDFLEPNILRTLIKQIKENDLEVLRINYQNVNENYEVFEPNKQPKLFSNFDETVCDGITFLNERLGFACYAVQFIIKRDLLRNCFFKPDIYFEDTEWAPRMLSKASKVASTDLICYNYLTRQGSITKATTEEKKRKLVKDRIALIESLLLQSNRKNDKRWYNGMIANIVIPLLSDIAGYNAKQRNIIISSLKEKRIFPLSSFHCSKSGRRKLIFINISPKIYCSVMHIIRASR